MFFQTKRKHTKKKILAQKIGNKINKMFSLIIKVMIVCFIAASALS